MSRYRTSRAGGNLVVHGVPIFVECQRERFNSTTGKREMFAFDREWIATAVAKALQAESEGYLPPMHVRHHEPNTDANDSVRAAGFFRITGTSEITFKGAPQMAVMADLTVTDEAVQREVLAGRLPYRSVEIFNVDEPALDSLALLDHEAPFLQLPMLLVASEDSGIASMNYRAGEHARAYFARGTHALFLFRDAEMTMADDDKKTDDDKDKGENMADGGLDVSAVVAAIKDGSISVAQFAEIKAAMEEMEVTEEPEADASEPAEASVPSESMKGDGSTAAKFAALQGKLDGTVAKLNMLTEERAREKAVAVAMQRLEGRPMGADIEKRLHTLHKTAGPVAFSAYVDSVVETVAPVGREHDFAAQKHPEAVLKFSDGGPEAIRLAAQHYAEWEFLHSQGKTNKTAERYVELSMQRSKVNG